MDLPRISIVTPSFNQGHYLERAIRSVLDQDYPKLEYFVVDGGSKDDSVAILRKFDKDITGWVSEPDEGQADAIAKGFRMCAGDVLAWLNSSDEYEPGAFRRVAEAWKKSGAALLYGDVRMIDEESRPLDVECTDHMDLPAMLYESVFPFQPASFWRRDAYERCGGVDPSFHFYMDLDLLVRLARTGGMCYVPATLSRLRRHADAKTAGGGPGWAAERRRILRAQVPAGSPVMLRRVLSFARRFSLFALQGRGYEAWKMVRKLKAVWRPLE